MVKFADDAYLVFPATNRISCAEEIKHVRDWASSNILRLNHVKSMEFVFVSLKAYGGDQCLLSGTFTEVKQRRPRLVLGWVTFSEDQAL